MSLLEVVELRKSYGEHVAVDGLSFNVDAGEVFGLLGPNGAGKSTTMMMLHEPTVGVDPQSREHLLDCIRKLSASGVAFIYASHYMEEVEAICHRVAIVDKGKLLTCGTLESLLNKSRADLHLRVLGTK